MKLQLNAEISRQHYGVFVCHIFKEEDEEGEDEKEDIEELSDERKNSSNDSSSVMNGINDYYLNLLYGKLRERAAQYAANSVF